MLVPRVSIADDQVCGARAVAVVVQGSLQVDVDRAASGGDGISESVARGSAVMDLGDPGSRDARPKPTPIAHRYRTRHPSGRAGRPNAHSPSHSSDIDLGTSKHMTKSRSVLVVCFQLESEMRSIGAFCAIDGTHALPQRLFCVCRTLVSKSRGRHPHSELSRAWWSTRNEAHSRLNLTSKLEPRRVESETPDNYIKSSPPRARGDHPGSDRRRTGPRRASCACGVLRVTRLSHPVLDMRGAQAAFRSLRKRALEKAAAEVSFASR